MKGLFKHGAFFVFELVYLIQEVVEDRVHVLLRSRTRHVRKQQPGDTIYGLVGLFYRVARVYIRDK